jgi:hypothetical protein
LAIGADWLADYDEASKQKNANGTKAICLPFTPCG